MTIAVVAINLILSLVFLSVAWRLWKLGKAIDRAADAILNADRITYDVLHASPEAIAKGELGTRNLRKNYQQVELQLLRLRQILALLSLGRGAWVGQSIMKRRPRKQKRPKQL